MTIEQMEIGLVVSGEEAAAKGMDTAADAADRLQKATQNIAKAAEAAGRALTQNANQSRAAGTALSGVGSAAGLAGTKLATFGSTLGMAAQGIGRMNAGAGQMVSVLASAVGSISTMRAALGPVGLALSLATTAFGLITSAMSRAREESERNTRAVRRHTQAQRDALPTIESYANAINASREARARGERLAAGQGSVVDQRAALEQMRARRDRLESVSDDRQGMIARGSAEALLDSGIAEAEANLQRARERARFKGLDADETGMDEGGGGRGSRGGGGGGGGRTFAVGESTVSGLDAFFGQYDRAGTHLVPDAMRMRAPTDSRSLASLMGGGDADLSDLTDTFNSGIANARLDDQVAQTATTAAMTFRDAWTSSVEDVISAWDRANTAARQAGQEQISVGELMAESAKAAGSAVLTYIGEEATGALRMSVDAWLDGSKSFVQAAGDMAKGVIKALVAESIVQAAVETARGVAALASVVTAPLAPGHFAAAATWAAVGGIAGGVGIATGAFGGGKQKTERARPENNSTQMAGGSTYVINWNQPAILAGTYAEAGRHVQRALEESTQRFGGR